MPKITFIDKNNKHEIDAQEGVSVLEIARNNGIDLEGPCEGALVCGLCHVVVDKEWYDKLPEITEEEEDVLDCVAGLKNTSRLACQIIMTNELDGLVVSLPEKQD